jgi:hypothetical protein
MRLEAMEPAIIRPAKGVKRSSTKVPQKGKSSMLGR